MVLSKPRAIALGDIPTGHTAEEGNLRWNAGVLEVYTGIIWMALGSGGGGDQTRILNITGADLGYANPATPGVFVSGGTPPTGMPGARIPVLDFADGANKNHAGWEVGSFYPNYGTESLQLNLVWTSTVTTGSVVWRTAFAAMADGDNITNKIFADPQSVTTAAPDASMKLTVSAISLSQAQADAVAAGDTVVIVVQRDPTDAADDMAGTARLVAASLSWVSGG